MFLFRKRAKAASVVDRPTAAAVDLGSQTYHAALRAALAAGARDLAAVDGQSIDDHRARLQRASDRLNALRQKHPREELGANARRLAAELGPDRADVILLVYPAQAQAMAAALAIVDAVTIVREG